MITACIHKTQNGSNYKKPNGRPIKPAQKSHIVSFQEDGISTEITQYPSNISQHLSSLIRCRDRPVGTDITGCCAPSPIDINMKNWDKCKERVLIRIKVHKGIGARVTACVLFSYHQFSSTHSVKYIYMHTFSDITRFSTLHVNAVCGLYTELQQ